MLSLKIYDTSILENDETFPNMESLLAFVKADLEATTADDMTAEVVREFERYFAAEASDFKVWATEPNFPDITYCWEVSEIAGA